MSAYVSDHRLNSYEVKMIGEPIRLPVRAITACISNKCKNYLIGFVYYKNGEKKILIEPDDLKSPMSSTSGADSPKYPKSVY